MKRVICDQCRKEEPPDHYGLAPKGWFTVDVRGSFAASKDYCSKACVVESFLEAERAALEAKQAVPAAVANCSECGGTGKLETLGGDWGKTPPGEKVCWMCDGTGVKRRAVPA